MHLELTRDTITMRVDLHTYSSSLLMTELCVCLLMSLDAVTGSNDA
jgi:hypothetical protein